MSDYVKSKLSTEIPVRVVKIEKNHVTLCVDGDVVRLRAGDVALARYSFDMMRPAGARCGA